MHTHMPAVLRISCKTAAEKKAYMHTHMQACIFIWSRARCSPNIMQNSCGKETHTYIHTYTHMQACIHKLTCKQASEYHANQLRGRALCSFNVWRHTVCVGLGTGRALRHRWREYIVHYQIVYSAGCTLRQDRWREYIVYLLGRILCRVYTASG